jgi:hypothetical protein
VSMPKSIHLPSSHIMTLCCIAPNRSVDTEPALELSFGTEHPLELSGAFSVSERAAPCSKRVQRYNAPDYVKQRSKAIYPGQLYMTSSGSLFLHTSATKARLLCWSAQAAPIPVVRGVSKAVCFALSANSGSCLVIDSLHNHKYKYTIVYEWEDDIK